MSDSLEEKLWTVTRQDDNGNTFVVKTKLSLESAEEVVEEYTAKRHHQVYSLTPYLPEHDKSIKIE